jgi:hypothetical protein
VLRNAVAQSAVQSAERGSTPVATAADINRQLQQLQSLTLPTTWPKPQNAWLAAFMIFVGWVVTAFAASMGAPFWFDILSKVAPLRSAGNVPPKATAVDTPRPLSRAESALQAIAPAGLQAAPAAQAEPALSTDDVTDIQRALGVGLTGHLDANTRDAIQSLQTKRGEAATGQLTRALIGELIGQ